MYAFNTCKSIVVAKHLEATLKITMSVQWIYMYYTIVEYGGTTVIVDGVVTR